MRTAKKVLIGLGLATGLALIAPVAGKAIVEELAADAARRFAAPARHDPDLETQAVRVAAMVHEQYRSTDGSADQPWLFRLRPYLTSSLLPEFVRFQEGAIEALLIEGVCDSAARATIYILNQIGIRAEQLNIIGAQGQAHSIVQAYNEDGTPFLLDPFFGVAPMKEGRVLDAATAQRLQRGGTKPEDLWLSITPEASFPAIYTAFKDVWVSPQGEPFEWTVTLDLKDRDRLVLGHADGTSNDLVSAGASHNLTVYWHYLGHRYDRGWTRSLIVAQPTSISFVLTEEVHDGVITSDRPPDLIEGTTVRYDLDAGESLSFHDGRAARDWTTLRSYQDVDYIVFSRL